MKTTRNILLGSAFLLVSGLIARADIKVLIDHNGEGNPQFKFQNAPQPVRHDAADRANATISIVDGENDSNGSRLRALNDGRLPEDDDDPGNNFFFAVG